MYRALAYGWHTANDCLMEAVARFPDRATALREAHDVLHHNDHITATSIPSLPDEATFFMADPVDHDTAETGLRPADPQEGQWLAKIAGQNTQSGTDTTMRGVGETPTHARKVAAANLCTTGGVDTATVPHPLDEPGAYTVVRLTDDEYAAWT